MKIKKDIENEANRYIRKHKAVQRRLYGGDENI